MSACIPNPIAASVSGQQALGRFIGLTAESRSQRSHQWFGRFDEKQIESAKQTLAVLEDIKEHDVARWQRLSEIADDLNLSRILWRGYSKLGLRSRRMEGFDGV